MNEGQKSKLYATTNDVDEILATDSLFESIILNETERNIIKLVFIYGYSAAEIAKKTSVTRQSVNQMKKRALKKLEMEIKKTI